MIALLHSKSLKRCLKMFDNLFKSKNFMPENNFGVVLPGKLINPLMTIGFTHHYHLVESTLVFMGFRCDFKILYYFFMKFL